ncbi:lysostaphin resistance A-like protein [Profundibacter sp.]|uniref:CPBP family intramembrane glutamic endopeptidase n=1 Tax=Profundibacter sp. TaxID=3101071 RepID=UPI003D0E1BEA
MRTPEFNAYIAPARLYPQIWRLVLGILLILFVYFGFIALVLWAGVIANFPMGSLRWANAVLTVQGAVPTLIMLFTFTGMALGPIIAAPACHMRGPGTLFGPLDVTLRGFVTATITVLLIMAAYSAVTLWFQPVQPNLPMEEWLRYLPYAIPLILIQTSAEELIFRGYLQQQLAARFKSPLVWMILPAALFAALHWDPEMGSNKWLVVGVTFAMALIASDLVQRTGSLGAAIGLHFANNIFALLFVSVQNTITGLALYVTPFDKADTAELPLALGMDLLLLLVIWRILRIALDR